MKHIVLAALFVVITVFQSCKKPDALEFPIMEISYSGQTPITEGTLRVEDELSPSGTSLIGTNGVIAIGDTYSSPLTLNKTYDLTLQTDGTTGETQEVTITVTYQGVVKTVILDTQWYPTFLISTGTISTTF